MPRGRILVRWWLLALIALNHIKDLLTMHLQFLGSLNSEFHGVSLDAEDLYDDATVDDDAFVQFA